MIRTGTSTEYRASSANLPASRRAWLHSLRHLFAVRLLTRGVPIAVVSELLRHSDII
jgi:site-specific recombinase XerD